MMTTYFTHLRCSTCTREFDPRELRTVCPDCTKTLLAQYDLAAARSALSREAIAKLPPEQITADLNEMAGLEDK